MTLDLDTLDTHLQSLFGDAAPPLDLAERAIAGLRRPQLSPAFVKASLAMAAVLALAATGYVGQQVVDRKAGNVQIDMLLKGVARDGRAPMGEQARIAATNDTNRQVADEASSKERAVASLIADSRRLADQGKYAQAAKVVDQIERIDPQNEYARGIKPLLFDRASLQNGPGNKDAFNREWVNSFDQLEERKIPYSNVLKYPPNWPDLSAKRDQTVREESSRPFAAAPSISAKPSDGNDTILMPTDDGKDADSDSVATKDMGRKATHGQDGQSVFYDDATKGTHSFRPDSLALNKSLEQKADRSLQGGVNGNLDGKFDGREGGSGKDEKHKEDPVQLSDASATNPTGGPGGGGAAGDQPAATRVEQPAAPSSKVIRSGTIEFEVDSFDSALLTVTKLVIEDSGFVASTDSSKLENGKTRGVITVRVPPDRLDTFVLKLRGLGDLKTQQIKAQDVGKQYTDVESQLRAARAMEERLIGLIKEGKGAIKDLLAAEKELGSWREKIEGLEGQKRYFDNLISMSTLAITLQERDIKASAGAIETEHVNAGIETDDVLTARTALLKAIDDAKGRIITSTMNQLQGGQLASTVSAEVPQDAAGPVVDRLKQLGKIARLDIDRKQTAVDGTSQPTAGAHIEQKPTVLTISLYNLANVAPRTAAALSIAPLDVEQAYHAALARLQKAGGRIVGSSLSGGGDSNRVASITAETDAASADAVLNDLRALGEVTRLQQNDNPDTQNTTAAKRGFSIQINALAAAQPRQTLALQIAAKDVRAAYQQLLELAQKSAVRITTSQLQEQDHDTPIGQLEVEIPADKIGKWETALQTAGDALTRNAARITAQDNIVDGKTRYTLMLLPADRLPPRKQTTATINVRSVESASNDFQMAAQQLDGRVVDSSISREPSGRDAARVTVDVPLAKAGDALDDLRKAGDVWQLSTNQSPQAPSGPLARARFEITFSAGDSLVSADDGVWSSVKRGLSTSIRGLAWSVQLIVIGLCLVLPWALIVWIGWKIIRRRANRSRIAAISGT